MSAVKQYRDFKSFYPYYLTEHSDPVNRMLHFTGTLLLLVSLVLGIITGKWLFFVMIPVLGYGFAWVGHFFIEKNKPATFTYPIYSLASDFVMFWHTITGQISKKMQEAQRKSNQQ
ncbi:MAG: DUF962 domain-containing protein [Bacteroidetes bacterium]|nr:DUF962 domain-containing protein [Bacteroidota bacterium]